MLLCGLMALISCGHGMKQQHSRGHLNGRSKRSTYHIVGVFCFVTLVFVAGVCVCVCVCLVLALSAAKDAL